MATDKNKEMIELLEEKYNKAMTVQGNLREKDIVIEAIGLYMETLQQKLTKLQEESNDSTELCK